MLEFKREVVQFKFDEEIHELRKPNNLEIKEYTEKLNSLGDKPDEKEQLLLDYLKKLGLKDGIYEQLLPYQTSKLIEALYESPKN